MNGKTTLTEWGTRSGSIAGTSIQKTGTPGRSAMFVALLAFPVFLFLAGEARAGATVSVAADQNASVYFDGEQIGTTPLSIKNVDPGFHEIRVVAPTGEARAYEFYSPRTITVNKEIAASFGASVGSYPSEAATGGSADYRVAGDSHVAPPPEYETREDRTYEEGRRYERERRKVRTRNTLLGAGVLNEVLNRGGSKKTVRGVALGGILLNELINRDRDN